jgi:hypothetical protein
MLAIFFIKKYPIFSVVNFFQFWVIKTLALGLDPDQQLGKLLNQYGSTTLEAGVEVHLSPAHLPAGRARARDWRHG